MSNKINNQIFESDCHYMTDMAIEFTKGYTTKVISKSLKRTDVLVDEELGKKLNKPKGMYITIETDSVCKGKRGEFKKVSKELKNALCQLLDEKNPIKSCLVACLGNPDLTADALGKRVSERLKITRHLEKFNFGEVSVSCVCPNVLGVTGIESFDIVKGVVERTKPDCVVVIDSLAGATSTRIASAFQITDTGITPGSGVSNHRVRFDFESLGVKTLAIGVPLVVYASTIIADALGDSKKPVLNEQLANLIVTPKDVDLFVDDCAYIVSSAINFAFFGSNE